MRLEALEPRQLLATFAVTNVSDAGPGSLRQAILDNDNASGLNSIVFDIPGVGVHSIAPASPLPAVNNPAIIDATTQPGYAGTPLVELNGANIFAPGVTPPTPLGGVVGLDLSGGSSTVEGLAVDRFTGFGIRATRDGNTIAADFIGTNPAGTQSLGNGSDGVYISSRNNTIGGSIPSSRDVISGNSGAGIILQSNGGGQPAGNLIEGNFIGTDATGTLDLGNAGPGVNVESSNNVIGGTIPAQGNVIAFNGNAGVQVGSYSFVSGVVQNRVVNNSIYGNAGLGIDLGGDGVTFNTPGGADFGPNDRQNYPVLTSAFPDPAGGTDVEGTLDDAPDTSYTVDFYSNLAVGQSGYGQGRTPVGSETFTTDASGHVDINSMLATSVPPGRFLSATATDSAGNTSEFSRSLTVAAEARSDLVLTDDNQNPTARAGVSQVYRYSVRNSGPAMATGVSFVDTLPSGASSVGATTDRGTVRLGGGTVTFAIGTLASGVSADVTITFTIPTAGPASNTGLVTADQPDPVPSNNAITQQIQVAAAAPVDLSLSGTVNPSVVRVGDLLTYNFVVTNPANNPATGVIFDDPLPAGVAIDSVRVSQGSFSAAGNDLTVNLGTIQGGANATLMVVVRALTAGPLSNFASIRGNEPDPNAINNSTTIDSTVTPAPAIDVAVAILAAPVPAVVGQPFSYAVLVANAGTAPATGVTLVDVLPDAALISSIRPSQGTFSLSGNVLTVQLGSLAVGALSEVTIALVPGAPGFNVDRASVIADQPEFDIANNFDSTATAVAGQPFPPAVLDQKLTVQGRTITGVILTFNEGLDPTSASIAANYRVFDLGAGNLPSSSGPSIAIASASYNVATRSVTLTFRRGLAVGRFYKLVVNGPGAPGLVDTYGNVLDGEHDGLQDGIYESLIGRGTKTRPAALQIGVPRPKPVPKAIPAVKHRSL